MDTFKNRRWLVIPTTLTGSIDFGQVLEASPETLRLSVDGTQTFVKYTMPQPSSVAALTTKSQEYTYGEILAILATPEWTPPYPIGG